jgi:hypothetical protein
VVLDKEGIYHRLLAFLPLEYDVEFTRTGSASPGNDQIKKHPVTDLSRMPDFHLPVLRRAGLRDKFGDNIKN